MGLNNCEPLFSSALADYYTALVKDHPERAVRSFMLGKMFRHEAEMRQTARQASLSTSDVLVVGRNPTHAVTRGTGSLSG